MCFFTLQLLTKLGFGQTEAMSLKFHSNLPLGNRDPNTWDICSPTHE